MTAVHEFDNEAVTLTLAITDGSRDTVVAVEASVLEHMMNCSREEFVTLDGHGVEEASKNIQRNARLMNGARSRTLVC